MARYKVIPVIYKSDGGLKKGYKIFDKKYNWPYRVRKGDEYYVINYFTLEEARQHCCHLNGKHNTSLFERLTRLFSRTKKGR